MPATSIVSTLSTQLLLCLSDHWDACRGSLQRHERTTGGDWTPVGPPVPVTLGRNGMAWGRGLHPAMAGPQKREGDGRAPAGVFAIPALFGHPDDAAPWMARARLPCHLARPDLKCVDDPASAHYTCLVDLTTVRPDWASCEDMLRRDGRYALGAVVAHNPAPAQAGAGSCIFLHVWESPAHPTSGCTAMALADMRTIGLWLDGARAPVLAQLPAAEYRRHQAEWDLPRR